MITAQFVLARGWSSSLILLAGGGTIALGFSHVDIVLPDGSLFGARTDFPVNGKVGVQRRPAGYGAATWIRRELFELAATPEQEKRGYDFLLAQEGKPYDQLAIVAFFTDRDWRDDDAWFCDELYLRFLEVAGVCPPLYLPANRMNPTGAANIASALKAVPRPQPVGQKA
jgi:hypothetical protein